MTENIKPCVHRRQIDIVTYKLLYFLPDTSLYLFVDDLLSIVVFKYYFHNGHAESKPVKAMTGSLCHLTFLLYTIKLQILV